MTEKEATQFLMQGAKVWNAWRKEYPGSIHFAKPHWYDSPGLNGGQMKGGNRVDFSGMNLSNISIHDAFAEGLNLRDSMFVSTHFEEGDFSRADFSGAIFKDTTFNKTILTDAVFDGATFRNCNLNRVILVGSSFCVEEITETVIYGISAWDINTSDITKQSKLVIEKSYQLYSEIIQEGKVPMMVDDIELAQFVYYLSNHKKMRDTINVLNDKGVLLLGQFKDGGLERLNRIRDWLQDRGYMSMIFDFARPDNLSMTETVITMAGLSKFIIADLTGSSVPAELQAILSQIKKPVLAFGNPYALFPDLEDQTDLIAIDRDVEESNITDQIGENLFALEELHRKRIRKLAERDKWME